MISITKRSSIGQPNCGGQKKDEASSSFFVALKGSKEPFARACTNRDIRLCRLVALHRHCLAAAFGAWQAGNFIGTLDQAGWEQ